MRELPAAVVASLVVHAIVIGSLRDVRARVAIPPGTTPDSPSPEPAPAVVEWIDVTLLPPPEPAHTTVTPTRAIRGATTTATATAKRHGSSEPASEPAQESAVEPGPERPEPRYIRPTSPWLVMRKPEKPSQPSEAQIAEMMKHWKPVPPRDDIPYERVSAEIDDARGALRRATTDDERMAARNALAAGLDARAREEMKPSGGGTYKAEKDTYTMRVAPDGSVDFDDKRNLKVDGLSGSFDVTDWAMRASGQDPYASAKLALLDRTRDQRVALGKRHRKAQLAASARIAQQNLDRLWVKTTDPADWKAGLFELWDECLEIGTADEVEGGAAARRVILGFIRSRLSGADAYTASELAAFNARRRSAERFAP